MVISMVLIRCKDEKWIFQKNISSTNLIKAYLEVVNNSKNIDKQHIKDELKRNNFYKGRSSSGSLSTMGVRFSQMCFYMFGYKTNNSVFVPTQTTLNILKNTNSIEKNMLVNLFSIQYPHPYSNTPDSFEIFAGRLIIKLLTEDLINKKLYIDEIIWFLPFIKKINEHDYQELVQKILEFRKLSYLKKKELFESVDNYESLFANCLHEIKYYFARIFAEFNVIKLVSDANHNEGNIFKFRHGKTTTYRSDIIDNNVSGYIKLNDLLLDDAKHLLLKYSPFDKPTTLKDPNVFSKQDWIYDLYENEIINYLDVVFPDYNKQRAIINALSNMTYMSKYSSKDGKEFEESLKPVFELFREIINVEIISGAGDTDLLCTVEEEENPNLLYKINVDGKSRKSSINLNPVRLQRHLEIHSSKYCIVVAPRFSRGTILDVKNFNVVLLSADVLAKYLSKECLSNSDSFADFNSVNTIISQNLGKDISFLIDKLTNERYGISL